MNYTEGRNVHINPIYDITFKNLFGVKGNEFILIDFLNQILGRCKNNEIVDLTYLNNETVGNNSLRNSSLRINKKKRRKPSTKVPKYFTKTSKMDIYVETTYKSDINTTTKNDNTTNINTTTNTITNSNNISNNDNEYDHDNHDGHEHHDIDDDEMININDKNILNIKLDELFNCFNENVNNLLKIIFENKIITLDVRKQINDILNAYKINNNESNNYFNIENTETKDKINSFKNFITDLFKPEENDNVINMEATTKNNERINIEIQINEDREMYKSSLFYASKIIHRSILFCDKYKNFSKVIMINILNFNLLKDTEKEMAIPHWEFTLKDKNTNEEKGFKDLLNIHFIELLKYKEYTVKHRNEMIDNHSWLLFLNDPNDEYFKQDNISEVFINAREQLLYLQEDSEFKDLYDKREKELIDEKSKMEGKFDEGIMEGIMVGKKEGIEIGEKKTELKHLMKSLKKGEKLEEIKDDYVETFTEEELVIINSFVEDEFYKIKDLALQLGLDENIILEICEKVNLGINERKGKKQKLK